MPRWSMWTAIIAVATSAVLTPSAAHAYSVICRHGQFDIDSRSVEQIHIAFGSSVCVFRTFSFRTDAENFARNNNMRPGTRCSCR